MAKKPFLRGISEISLLEEKSGKSVCILSAELSNLVMGGNDYLKRMHSQVENGKLELQKKLDDVRSIIFNKEDLVLWLSKMKEDAISETDLILIKYHASVFMNEDKIDFERAGYLSGIYEEAERYLNTLVAIEPLDQGKAHYVILDRLEKLDEGYIDNNNIPGYYDIQKDSRIKLQKFQLKNLDDYWKEHLALKDKYEVSEDFGDLQHLLNNYHGQFRWQLVNIKPREEIKNFLDFHLKKYEGDPIDFVNHVEFRVLPELDGVARSNYPIYQILLREWIKEKRSKINTKDQSYLVESMVAVSAAFLDNVEQNRKMADENKYNTVICSLLNQRFSSTGWHCKDQSLGGSTDTNSKSNRAGVAFRDLIVVDRIGQHLSTVEFMRLKYVPTEEKSDSEISTHLWKIFRNEPLGLSPLFIVVYCETKSFAKTWQKYLDYVDKMNFENYSKIEFQRNFSGNPELANIKVACAKHIREMNEIDVFHVFINMYP